MGFPGSRDHFFSPEFLSKFATGGVDNLIYFLFNPSIVSPCHAFKWIGLLKATDHLLVLGVTPGMENLYGLPGPGLSTGGANTFFFEKNRIK